jgi:predicted amidohydrolase YtcJ
MQRLAKLGVLVSAQVQPYQDKLEMLRHWGEGRAERAVPIRELLDHRIPVSSGTDWPARSNNPFVTMSYYVTRNTLDGPLGLSQRISRAEALRLATINYAYLTFEEDVKGSIEPGKLADFVILSADLLTVPDEQIRSIAPVATYVGGRKVFQAPNKP